MFSFNTNIIYEENFDNFKKQLRSIKKEDNYYDIPYLKINFSLDDLLIDKQFKCENNRFIIAKYANQNELPTEYNFLFVNKQILI